jgi:hypothetical protein
MLGSGWASSADVLPSFSLGSGWDSSADALPSFSLGSGWDSLADLIPDLGIRGPQVEPYDLELDRLANITSASLSIIAGVDLTAIATTALYTAPQKSYILGVLIRVTAANSVTVPADASIGVNPSTDNLFAEEQLISLDVVDDLYGFWANVGTGTILNASDQLDLVVTTGATASSLIATVYVIGTQL